MGIVKPEEELTLAKNKREDMTEAEWKAATKFDSTDWGWIIMSIGMAIGAGIVFLPVQVGLVGIWVFLISSAIAYPALYLLQKLFINTLVVSPKCEDYPSVIGQYLGKNWGFLLGILYFLMIVVGLFSYSIAITNDSASFLHSFGVTDMVLSTNPFYGLVLLCILVALASRGEKVLFKISTGMVLVKLAVVVLLGIIMIQHWDIANIGAFPNLGYIVKQTIIMMPFTVFSIIFVQSLSPMVISYRSHNKSIEVARYKAHRTMKIAFWVLFFSVFFYAISFNLAMSHEQAAIAAEQNISALAMAAQGNDGAMIKVFSFVLNIFAVMTAFFGIFLGFKESCQGIAINILSRFMPEERINKRVLSVGILVFAVLLAWSVVALNLPILLLLKYYGAIIALVACIIPVYLVCKVPFLAKYRKPSLILIAFIGVLLILSPILESW
ncbi:aromatic amino acid transport family protein [Peribacillus sp. FSL E2-0159]|uniref:aromatic amino acid transport family protein n=1 Tax=Peribacillus sp. FSL E2-0159 TaxID=2975289 RepID=UPI00315A0E4D